MNLKGFIMNTELRWNFLSNPVADVALKLNAMVACAVGHWHIRPAVGRKPATVDVCGGKTKRVYPIHRPTPSACG